MPQPNPLVATYICPVDQGTITRSVEPLVENGQVGETVIWRHSPTSEPGCARLLQEIVVEDKRRLIADHQRFMSDYAERLAQQPQPGTADPQLD